MLYRFRFLALSAALLAFVGCDTTDPDPDPVPDPVPLNAQMAADVEADPAVGRDPDSGQPISNDLFTLFDLDAGQVVLSSSETDTAVRAADSASTAWDIGFKGTTIIFNGGTSGPGEGSAQILTQTFDSVTEAPATGYLADGGNPDCPGVETPRGTFPGEPFA
ncbi:MAG: HmuY family protein, partial [Bacteroidota bacterium]